ncbi:MAG: efflux RND transporter permease subunit [Bacteroidales bacterium]|jgi:multidrug efflux pump subunit AcrB|nr:efflux RND transporter permease subunit [Bacteroidales bacterium]
MKRKYDIIEWSMKHSRIVFLLSGLLVILGIIALVVMPKQEFPGYTIRQGIIAGVYPGATSEEVEKQLADPLEDFLFSYPEVKRSYTTTTSRNGICYAMVELEDNVKNKDEVWSKIKHGLTLLKSQLPQGVVALVAQDDFGDTSAILIALGSGSRSYRELKDYADDLGNGLRRIESVANVRLYGEQKEQITVYADPYKLSSYAISDKLIMAGFFSQSLAPGGNVKSENVNVPVHLKPAYGSVQEIEDQLIYSDPDGNMLRVKDVAKVKREYPSGKSYITFNGNPCLVLSVEMREGFNIMKFGSDVNRVIDEYKATRFPDDLAINSITDQSEVVSGSVVSFLRDLMLAIVVVILVMMILFPLRTALVAAIVIPLNTFISVGLMFLFGIPLNTVTFAALVVVLGMTVDNSIVIIDGYVHNLKNGLKPWDAALDSAHRYFMPMFLATTCICLIFYPILLLFTGQFAEFIYYFPYTFTINLMVSLILAVLLIPILEVALIKSSGSGEDEPGKKRITGKVHDVYVRLLGWNFRRPWLTISIGVFSILVSILMIPHIKFRMMPVAERDQFAVEISLPDGTPITTTGKVADSLRMMLAKDERIISITQFVGISSPRFHISYAPKMPSDSYAQFIVNTRSSRDTEALLDEYTDLYSHYFENAYIKFKLIDFQYVNAFEFRFYGDNIEDLKKSAGALSVKMKAMPELTNVVTDWGDMLPVLEVSLDPLASSKLGVSRGLAAANLMLATGEFSMGSISENNEIIPVVLNTGSEGEKTTLESIADTYISTLIPSVNVPLRQIAEVTPSWSENRIVHRNGIRTITVSADTRRNVLPAKLLSHLQDMIEEEIVPALQQGTVYQVGGEPEFNKEHLTPVIHALIAAFAVIFFFLLFTYGKFGLTFISLFTLFLFMFGAVFGLWISNLTVGLTAVLGLIGLFGITVRNVILMFQHAEQRFAVEGWSARDAAWDAGKRRMIPIFLTSAAASTGVVPMILSGSSFWAPVGIVIFAGGIFLLVMTITILPVLYWKLNESKK